MSPVTPASADAPQWYSTAGALLLKACRDCGRLHHYPRPLCPFCMSDATEWVEAGGLGTVYTYSVVRQKDGVFVIAFVTLDEGVSLLTHIIGGPTQTGAASLIGRRVRMESRQPADPSAPTFRLID